MNREEKAQALEEEEAARIPGMGSALLTVLVMIVTTAILVFLIYLVMVAIRPIEARNFKKVSQVEPPALRVEHARHT